jgi:hypothetical protein
MQREIKFRLIKNNKIVGYERFALSAWQYSKDGRQWKYTPIVHDDKDRYIGQIVNNQEVYERDILSDEERLAPPDVMVWNEKWLGFRLSTENQNTFLQNTGYDTIIGNIHENPELLEP